MIDFQKSWDAFQKNWDDTWDAFGREFSSLDTWKAACNQEILTNSACATGINLVGTGATFLSREMRGAQAVAIRLFLPVVAGAIVGGVRAYSAEEGKGVDSFLQELKTGVMAGANAALFGALQVGKVPVQVPLLRAMGMSSGINSGTELLFSVVNGARRVYNGKNFEMEVGDALSAGVVGGVTFGLASKLGIGTAGIKSGGWRFGAQLLGGLGSDGLVGGGLGFVSRGLRGKITEEHTLAAEVIGSAGPGVLGSTLHGALAHGKRGTPPPSEGESTSKATSTESTSARSRVVLSEELQIAFDEAIATYDVQDGASWDPLSTLFKSISHDSPDFAATLAAMCARAPAEKRGEVVRMGCHAAEKTPAAMGDLVRCLAGLPDFLPPRDLFAVVGFNLPCDGYTALVAAIDAALIPNATHRAAFCREVEVHPKANLPDSVREHVTQLYLGDFQTALSSHQSTTAQNTARSFVGERNARVARAWLERLFPQLADGERVRFAEVAAEALYSVPRDKTEAIQFACRVGESGSTSRQAALAELMKQIGWTEEPCRPLRELYRVVLEPDRPFLAAQVRKKLQLLATSEVEARLASREPSANPGAELPRFKVVHLGADTKRVSDIVGDSPFAELASCVTRKFNDPPSIDARLFPAQRRVLQWMDGLGSVLGTSSHEVGKAIWGFHSAIAEMGSKRFFEGSRHPEIARELGRALFPEILLGRLEKAKEGRMTLVERSSTTSRQLSLVIEKRLQTTGAEDGSSTLSPSGQFIFDSLGDVLKKRTDNHFQNADEFTAALQEASEKVTAHVRERMSAFRTAWEGQGSPEIRWSAESAPIDLDAFETALTNVPAIEG